MSSPKRYSRTLSESTAFTVLRTFPRMKTSRKPQSYQTKTKRKARKGICILFNGVRYQTLSSFAKDHGFDSGGKHHVKMEWYKEQLSKCPLRDCLRFLCSGSLTSISNSTPKDVREGLVDAKNMKEVFVPATRMKTTGNAGLFKLKVL